MNHFQKNSENCNHNNLVPYVMTALMDKEQLQTFDDTQFIDSIQDGSILTHMVTELMLCPECGITIEVEHGIERLNRND